MNQRSLRCTLARWFLTSVLVGVFAGVSSWGVGANLGRAADDPGETQNLAADLPDQVAQMQATLERLIVTGRSTPGAKQPNDVRVKRYPVPSAATR